MYNAIKDEQECTIMKQDYRKKDKEVKKAMSGRERMAAAIGVACVALFLQGIITYHDCSLYLFLVLLSVAFRYRPSPGINTGISRIFPVIFALITTAGNEHGLSSFFSLCSEILSEASGRFEVPSAGVFIVPYYIIVFAGWYILWGLMLDYVISLMGRINLISDIRIQEKGSGSRIVIVLFFIGFLCYLPYYLRYYPGIITRDGIDQMSQVLGVSQYNNHHPWIHTLIIKVFYSLGYSLFGSMASGVATYSLISMMLMVLVFSMVIFYLIKMNSRKSYILLSIAFFLLIPVNALFSITMWKDTFFSGSVLLFTLFLYEKESSCREWTVLSKIVLFILSFLFCVLRTNGFYAFILFTVLFFIEKRDRLKTLIIPFVAAIIATLILNGPIMGAAGVISNDKDPVESLSIPAQQIAAVIVYNGSIDSEQLNLLSKVIDAEKVSAAYSPELSDGIKDLVRATGNQEFLKEHRGEFLRLWLELGLRNPGIYLRAYIDQTRGYWYHNPGLYWVYARNIWENDLGLMQTPLIKGIPGKIIDYIPAVLLLPYYMTWSSAASTWLVVIMMLFAILHKKDLFPYFPSLCVVFTLLIATPVANEFRYAYAVFISLPFLLFYTLATEDNDITEIKT